MIFAHITKSLRETFPGRASEWALSLILLNWGIILLLNPLLFSSPSYRPLAGLAYPENWSIFCMVAGGGRLLVLAINGAWRRSPHMRAAGAFVTCFFWFQISIGFLQAGTWSTGLAVYPVLLLLDSYNVIRAMGEAAISDAAGKRAKRHEPGG
ncbi:hypothetical protein GRZ55_11080 [Chelativorans sp. ZYF759]|uniref:hypothetical protein n=1 Tax=Chelativorans sp. ZYF759 TaxID=2692213 RepID=UPI00145D8858|nr:hypothetical protein [Chelativorans sp. ZYF759]NMG39786.1 hypothetical protein [Chelativorans sp. ZYF759]